MNYASNFLKSLEIADDIINGETDSVNIDFDYGENVYNINIDTLKSKFHCTKIVNELAKKFEIVNFNEKFITFQTVENDAIFLITLKFIRG